MLQVAVHPLRELRQVKNTALLLKQTNGGKDLMYDKYIQLLSYAASEYDNGQVPAKNKRQVYQSEIQEDDFGNYKNGLLDSEPFDIDTPVKTIQAYAANYRSNPKRAGTDNRVRMPNEQWLSLDDKTKAIWDSIDDKFKNIILGYTSSSPSFPTRSSKPSPKSPTKPPFSSRKAFLNEML
jgi:phage gpG-like protein